MVTLGGASVSEGLVYTVVTLFGWVVVIILVALALSALRPGASPAEASAAAAKGGRRRRKPDAGAGRDTANAVATVISVVTAATAIGALIVTSINVNGTLQTAQATELNARFSQAVAQVGDKDPGVRVGGIYSLEQIADESRVHHTPIIELLSAFVRYRGRTDMDLQLSAQEIHDEVGAMESAQQEKCTIPRGSLRPDIDAALTVIARRANLGWESDEHFNLMDGLFFTTTLLDGQFQHMLLYRAHFECAYVMNIDFSGSALIGAHLDYVLLQQAKFHPEGGAPTSLANASLQHADLTGADLTGAHLDGANLVGATVVGANFTGATMKGANLEGVDLRQARGLTSAQLGGAMTDASTLLPAALATGRGTQ